MRNISFAKTTPQILAETKRVTRRDGWGFLKAGERLQGIEKGQGLKKGEKVRKLKVIEIVSSRWEPLDAITPEDVALEGFPNWTPEQFINFYLEGRRVKDRKMLVNRIEFNYVKGNNPA